MPPGATRAEFHFCPALSFGRRDYPGHAGVHRQNWQEPLETGGGGVEVKGPQKPSKLHRQQIRAVRPDLPGQLWVSAGLRSRLKLSFPTLGDPVKIFCQSLNTVLVRMITTLSTIMTARNKFVEQACCYLTLVLEIYQAKLWLSLFSCKAICFVKLQQMLFLSQSTASNLHPVLQSQPLMKGRVLIKKSST